MLFKIVCFFSCVYFALGCRKVAQNDVLIIGHGACGLENISVPFQDNTNNGIEYAFSHEKCDGIEIDLQLSQDNELILYHNTTLSENTNKKHCIGDYTRQSLIETSYSSLNKEKIMALDQLKFLNNKSYYFDIRHFNSCTQSAIDVNRYISVLSNFVLPNKLYLTVSSVEYITPFKLAGYKIIYVANTEQEAINVMENYNLDGVELRLNNISTTFVKTYKTEEFSVGIYDVRAAKSIQKAIEMNPTYLSTDDIRKTINCLR